MLKIGDLVIHYMYGYIAVVTEVANHQNYPYKVMFLSPPREDDEHYEDTEYCDDNEIKLLDSFNETP